MCNHVNHEAAMVVLDPGTPERHHRDGVWCDPCLAPLVSALNGGGLRTVASCCGHGAVPGSVILADGRWLIVVASDDEAYPLIAGRGPDEDWPEPTCPGDCGCRTAEWSVACVGGVD